MRERTQKIWSVPEPFLLNCWKHHLNYVRYHLDEMIHNNKKNSEELKFVLLKIGSSQMDLYTGSLSPREIAYQVKERLTGEKCFDKSFFETWIYSPPGGFKSLVISDYSEWTLRIGLDDRYIHIHPSRYSINTIRIKAPTLKTLIALKWMMKVNGLPLNLETLNSARKEFFGASPVKSLSAINNIRNYLALLKIE